MPSVGAVLADRYRIDGPLGAGGMASVWRAHDLRLGRDVAIKILPPNMAANPSLAARFDREARALAATAHPSIVAIYDVEAGNPDAGDDPFYVMELCEGGSLADRLASERRLPPAELAPILTAIGAGLAELHERGVVHRDIKPHNILFAGGRAKLADFGLVHAGAVDGEALTAVGTTVGTLAYLAPELLAGAEPTAASDVYALGVLTFQALTGRLPRPASSVAALVDHREDAAPAVSTVMPALGTAFDEPLGQALASKPSDRPGAVELAAAVSAAAEPAVAPEPAAAKPVVAAAALASVAPNGPDIGRVVAPPPSIRAPEPGPAPPDWLREARERRAGARQGPRPALLALGAFVVAIALLLGASALFGDGGSRPNPGAAATTTAPPTTAPPTTATPPPATAEPLAEARAALADVSAAIDAAQGGPGGLKGKEANDLRALVGDVAQAIEAGDAGSAREAARALAERAEEVGDELDDESGEALTSSVERLLAALPAD